MHEFHIIPSQKNNFRLGLKLTFQGRLFLSWQLKKSVSHHVFIIDEFKRGLQALVVQTLDSAIHGINHYPDYPADKY